VAWPGTAPDEVAPTLQVQSTDTTGDPVAARAGEVLTFSPNGDGIADKMLVRRSLSEPAYVDAQVRDGGGEVVHTFSKYGTRGMGTSLWNGHTGDGNVVPDGLYQVRLTPRDRAGNVGEPASVDVRVLTSLRRLRSAVEAIHVSDGDGLADGALLSATLTRDALVTWEVRSDGDTVKRRLSEKPVAAGDLEWRWDGTDQDGTFVRNGLYTAFISATTDVGTLRYRVPIRVGNWRMGVDDRTPRRGHEVRLTAHSLEAMAGAPSLEISQPGLEPRLVPMKLRDKHLASVTFSVAKGGADGTIRLRVLARDSGGQKEVGGTSLRLR